MALMKNMNVAYLICLTDDLIIHVLESDSMLQSDFIESEVALWNEQYSEIQGYLAYAQAEPAPKYMRIKGRTYTCGDSPGPLKNPDIIVKNRRAEHYAELLRNARNELHESDSCDVSARLSDYDEQTFRDNMTKAFRFLEWALVVDPTDLPLTGDTVPEPPATTAFSPAPSEGV